MTEAIIQELELNKNYLTEKIETVYFGGGTPSLLPGAHIKRILDKVYKTFEVDNKAELTIEANPEDLTKEHSELLNGLGFNRLSIGVQSFDDSTLSFLNRNHDANSAKEAIKNARLAGFENISLDLIYGIPGQLEKQWIANLEHAITLNPNHISAYALTVEPGTTFGNWLKKGRLKVVSEDLVANQFEIMIDLLKASGYEQYEVSNFALPGFESKHNSSYWQGITYLGVGPGAHSYNGHSRQFNISNNVAYIKAIKAKKLPFEIEKLSKTDRLSEHLFIGLRTKGGISLKDIKTKFNYEIEKDHQLLIDKLIDNGQALLENDRLILTSNGLLIADSIIVELMPDQE